MVSPLGGKEEERSYVTMCARLLHKCSSAFTRASLDNFFYIYVSIRFARQRKGVMSKL